MYGKKKFRPINKSAEVLPPIQPHLPTLICTKCKQIKNLINGYSDINLTFANSTKLQYRICGTCFDLLKVWING